VAKDEIVVCPECGANVKESRLRRHLSKAHSKELPTQEERPRGRPGKWRRKVTRNLTRIAMIALVILVAVAAAYYLIFNPSPELHNYTVYIQVVNGTSDAVSGATVKLYNSSYATGNLITNATGWVCVTNLTNSTTYAVIASYTGLNTNSTAGWVIGSDFDQWQIRLSPLPEEKLPIALFNTSLGSFKVELDTVRAPATAGNFIDLVKQGFYNGLTFHRIAQGFVMQGGDPFGNGTGGSGKTISWEDTGLENLKYTLAMARGQDPDSASSQFYANLKDNPSLDESDPPYVVFGRVVEGFETVDLIGSLYPPGSVSYDGPPTSTVKMNVSMVVQ